jgi:hypothetical protein
VSIFEKAFQALGAQFYASAEMECADQENIIVTKFHCGNPRADVVLVKGIAGIFILGAEFRGADGERGIGWIEPCGKSPGVPPMAEKAFRRLRQA